MTFASVALPSLQDVPGRYLVRTGSSFVRPLLLSMLDHGVIEEQDITRRPRSELDLCKRTLTRRWKEIVAPLQFFDWQLRIYQAHQSELTPYMPANDFDFWAVIGTKNGAVTCRQLVVGGAIEHLERVRAGLGETVLAALCDVLHRLGHVATPKSTRWLAEFIYWYGIDGEKEAVEEAMAYFDVKTVEELTTASDFFTHDAFYADMPRWAARPLRKLTHRQVARAAKLDDFAALVVRAMDDLWKTLVNDGPFAELGSPDAGVELIDFGLIVRWSDRDATTRVIDDYCAHSCEGDYIDSTAVCGLNLNGDGISVWLDRMRATARLAAAAERVLDLLSSQSYGPNQTLVQVFA